MTNFEKWQAYTGGLSSPQNYIDWGFYYLVGASLQRRVWLSANHQKCFPNMYAILVGNPGIGKGLVIREVSNILGHWKFKDANKVYLPGVSQAQQEVVAATQEEDLKQAQEKELQPKNKKNDYIEPLLFPMAADATTYEALVEAVSDGYRHINYIENDPITKNPRIKIYGHSSLCFSLQELASLLRARTNDTVNYLLGLYDCPDDYIYNTKTKGKDRVKRGCINLLAGTTPHFMQSIFNDGLIDEGLSSRTFFIHAQRNRKSVCFIPDLTEEQEGYRKDILSHVRALSSLYGRIELSQEIITFMEDWWQKFNDNLASRPNLSSKLLPYYARKNIHVMKLAMILHFSESLEMKISIDKFHEAISILDKEEKNMHYALMMDSENKINKIAERVVDYLKTGPKEWPEILCEFHSMGKKEEIEEALLFLAETGKLAKEQEADETTGKEVLKYKLK